MPTNRTVKADQPYTVTTAAASPVTVSVTPHRLPVVLVITSASPITVTATTTNGESVDVTTAP